MSENTTQTIIKLIEAEGYKVVDAKRLDLLEEVAEAASWFIAYRGTVQEDNKESELRDKVAEWEALNDGDGVE